MYAWELRWADVDPRTHVFDIARVQPAIERIVRSSRDRGHVFAELERLLVAEFGDWARIFSWAVNGGGPIQHYCCLTHSILPDRDPRPEPTIQRVRDALLDLQAFLTELADIFERVDRTGSPAEIVERAVPQLFDLIAQRTSFEDAWYSSFERVVTWFAEVIVGDDLERIRNTVEQTISGRFASWTGPTETVRDETFLAIAIDIDTIDRAREPIDGTDAWLAIRPTAFTAPPSARPFAAPTRRTERVDGHTRYIATYDAARSAERADRMTNALTLCRDAARHRLPLAFDLLAEWQAIVLGEPSPPAMRTTDAFAKQGRERYPVIAMLHERVESALLEANDPATPLAIRAARVYLDICNLHPFVDGNSRAARLALDHVLWREGFALHDARGIFTLSRAAGDARAAWSLAAAIERLAH